ncbi:MAG: ribonuclease J [Bacilli bacterium]|nr:ribonuclease J [Bacilli bacterium]
MSKINIMSLGGLNENGKNLYTVSVDDKLLVFDAGLKYAPDKMYGIDYIIPDFKYLKENKNKIVGVFLTHPHSENMGAIIDLIIEIPDIVIYASPFTTEIIRIECELEGINLPKIITIKPHKKIDFKTFSVFPFSVTHSVPETLGYSINTKDGSIIYMADFIIDPTMKGHYDMDLGKLAYIGKQGVLCLMAESVFAEKKGHTSPKHKLDSFFKSLVEKHKNRIIFSVLPLHIHTIQEIFEAIKDKKRKVVIMGKELHSIINMCINKGYLDIDKELIGDLTNLKDANSVILISNDRQMPYYNINRIVSGYDKFITIDTKDTVCFAEPSYDAYEGILVKLMNDIAVKGVNIETVPKEKNVRYHASSEDLMLLVKLFNPKYYMPIKGEYRYQVENANLAYKVGVLKENILLKGNGDVVTFENGVLQNNFKHINIGDVLIDGKSTKDIGELVLKDREMLGNNGLVLISATLDKKTKQIIIGPEVLTRGFMYEKENVSLISTIKEEAIKIINSNIHNNKYADYSQMRNDMREIVGEILYKETESKPVILTVVQEV